jgi:hypothetical protein
MTIFLALELHGAVFCWHEPFVRQADKVLNGDERDEVLLPGPWCLACGSDHQWSTQDSPVGRTFDGPRGIQGEFETAPYLDF